MQAPQEPRSYIEVEVGEFHCSNAFIYEIDDGRQIGMGKPRGRLEVVRTRRANIHTHPVQPAFAAATTRIAGFLIGAGVSSPIAGS
ncbi:hypothetical protein [Sinorhizobium meliloti]|uniref:hypothetical protein n=1 Tax=Rhizobium meliloti TaxID=382 RepID=UPI0013E40FA4|nr:hypothetical protein [Sinorhizobium meliloti]